MKAEVNGITIINDFAHHPTAIEQTIHALRARFAGRKLWVVLKDPRSNTMRRNVLQDALAASLSLADEIVLAAIFKSEAIPEVERLDINRLTHAIEARGKRVQIFPDADAIVRAIATELRSRDVVAILSNGGFGGIMRSYRSACAAWQLRHNHPGPASMERTAKAVEVESCTELPRAASPIRTILMLAFWALALPVAAIIGIPWTYLTEDVSLLYRMCMFGAWTGVRIAGVKVRTVGLKKSIPRAPTSSCRITFRISIRPSNFRSSRAAAR